MSVMRLSNVEMQLSQKSNDIEIQSNIIASGYKIRLHIRNS